MKTLDEVIADITKQSGLEIRDVRKPDKDRFWVGRETYNDALHYLKELRNKEMFYNQSIDHMLLMINEHEDRVCAYLAEMRKNDPLTWDELKQMEGKPVWVENKFYKKWLIAYQINENDIIFDGNGFYTQAFVIDYGKSWQAYRKERL